MSHAAVRNDDRSLAALVDRETRLRIWVVFAILLSVVGVIGDQDTAEAAVTAVPIAGTGVIIHEGEPAIGLPLASVDGIAVAPDGTIYFTEFDDSVVYAVDAGGTDVRVVAGIGVSGFDGDGGPATEAALLDPTRLDVDDAGNLLIIDQWRIRRVHTDGIIDTVAGTGSPTKWGTYQDGPALEVPVVASLVAAGPNGSIYVYQGQWIRHISASGDVETLFRDRYIRSLDATDDALWFAWRNGVRRYDLATHAVTEYVDTKVFPVGSVAAVSDDEIYFTSKTGYDEHDSVIRRVRADRSIETIGGTGRSGGSIDESGYEVTRPLIAAASNGVVVSADRSGSRYNRILDVSGEAGALIVGRHEPTFVNGDDALEFGGVPTAAIEVDGRFLFGTEDGLFEVVDDGYRRIAGTGVGGYLGDGGVARDARVHIDDLAVGPDGTMYFVDSLHHVVRAISSTSNVISTVAGTGVPGSALRDLHAPGDIAVASDGSVFVADTNNRRVQRIDPDGSIVTVAGGGDVAYSGSQIGALSADIGRVRAIALLDGQPLMNVGAGRYDEVGRWLTHLVDGELVPFAGHATEWGFEDGGLSISQPAWAASLVVEGDDVYYSSSSDRGVWVVRNGRTYQVEFERFGYVHPSDVGTYLRLYESSGSYEASRYDVRVFRVTGGAEEPVVGRPPAALPGNDLSGFPIEAAVIPGVSELVAGPDGLLYMQHATSGINRFDPTPGSRFENVSGEVHLGHRLFGVTETGAMMMWSSAQFVEYPITPTSARYGTGTCGSSGDGGPAALADICPIAVALDPVSGSITFLNRLDRYPAPPELSVRRIDGATGIVTTINDAVPSSRLTWLFDFRIDKHGTIFKYASTGLNAQDLVIRPVDGPAKAIRVPHSQFSIAEVVEDGSLLALGYGENNRLEFIRIEQDGSYTIGDGFAVSGFADGPDGSFYIARGSRSNGGRAVVERIDGLASSPPTPSTAPATTTTTTTTQPPPATTTTTTTAPAITTTTTAPATTTSSTTSTTMPPTVTTVPPTAPSTTTPATEATDDVGIAAVTPSRLLETRADPGYTTADGRFERRGMLPAAQVLELDVIGRAGVPPDARSVILNVTAIARDDAGYLTVYPCDDDRPVASSVNYRAGEIVPNAVLAKLSDAGQVCIFTLADVDMVVDIFGFVPADGDVGAVTPRRILETRNGLIDRTVDGRFEGIGRRARSSITTVQVAGRGGVPEDAVAALLNVTAVDPGDLGFLTVFPCDADRPLASNVNYGPGEVVPTAVAVQLDDRGRVCVFTRAATDLVIDTAGFVPPGSVFGTVVPARVLETRAGANERTADDRFAGGGPIAPGETARFQVTNRAGVPGDASAVWLNVTSVNSAAPGYLTVYRCGDDIPGTSSVNYLAGEVSSSAVLAPVDVDGNVCIATSATTDMVVDVNGYLR